MKTQDLKKTCEDSARTMAYVDPHLLHLLALQFQLDNCLQLQGLALLKLQKRKRDALRRRRHRSCWIRPWFLERKKLGFADTLMITLEKKDPRTFQRMCGIPPDMFREIIGKIRVAITRQTTQMRLPISIVAYTPRGYRLNRGGRFSIKA